MDEPRHKSVIASRDLAMYTSMAATTSRTPTLTHHLLRAAAEDRKMWISATPVSTHGHSIHMACMASGWPATSVN